MKNCKKEKFTLWKLSTLVLAVGGIIAGAFLTVTSVENMSTLTGISTTILGLTLTAVATSLPELFATIISQEEHEEKMTIGNIIGSNIYNLLFIGGLILVISPQAVIGSQELIILTFATLTFVFIIRHYKGERIPKKIGLFLFLCFVLYLFLLKVS